MTQLQTFDDTQKLIQKYGTRDPFELIDALPNTKLWPARSLDADGLRGFATIVNRVRYIAVKLLQVKKGMKVVVRYFVRTTESTGKYISLTGTVIMIDPVYRELKVMQDSDRKAAGIEKELPVIISFDDIADLAGEGITSIEDYLGIEKYPDDI